MFRCEAEINPVAGLFDQAPEARQSIARLLKAAEQKKALAWLAPSHIQQNALFTAIESPNRIQFLSFCSSGAGVFREIDCEVADFVPPKFTATGSNASGLSIPK